VFAKVAVAIPMKIGKHPSLSPYWNERIGMKLLLNDFGNDNRGET